MNSSISVHRCSIAFYWHCKVANFASFKYQIKMFSTMLKTFNLWTSKTSLKFPVFRFPGGHISNCPIKSACPLAGRLVWHDAIILELAKTAVKIVSKSVHFCSSSSLLLSVFYFKAIPPVLPAKSKIAILSERTSVFAHRNLPEENSVSRLSNVGHQIIALHFTTRASTQILPPTFASLKLVADSFALVR